jgi:hypothetical protein
MKMKLEVEIEESEVLGVLIKDCAKLVVEQIENSEALSTLRHTQIEDLKNDRDVLGAMEVVYHWCTGYNLLADIEYDS